MVGNEWKLIAVTGAIMAAIAALMGHYHFAGGVVAGSTISGLSMIMMTRALIAGEKNPKRAQRIFVKRYIFRLILSFSALAVGTLFGVAVVLGVLVGLFTYILSYLPEVWRIIIGRKG